MHTTVLLTKVCIWDKLLQKCKENSQLLTCQFSTAKTVLRLTNCMVYIEINVDSTTGHNSLVYWSQCTFPFLPFVSEAKISDKSHIQTNLNKRQQICWGKRTGFWLVTSFSKGQTNLFFIFQICGFKFCLWVLLVLINKMCIFLQPWQLNSIYRSELRNQDYPVLLTEVILGSMHLYFSER